MFTTTGRFSFHHRSLPPAVLAILFVALALLALTAPAAGQTSERCFPETGFCIAGPIRAFWERNGGLPVFGLPIAPQQEDQIEGRSLQAQWFERNRLEIQSDGTITLGRLGAQRLGQQGRSWFAEFTTGASEARTHAMSTTQDGKTLFTANQVVNEIAALDALTGAIKWSLKVGGNPSEVLATTDGKIAYVSLRNDTKVQVVDLDRRAIVAEVVVGNQPDTLLLTPDGRTLVVSLRGNPAQIAIVDVAGGQTATQVTMAGTLAGHHALSANGRYSFVAVEGPASVAVVDNWTATVVATHAYAGGGRPHGIFYEPGSLTRGD